MPKSATITIEGQAAVQGMLAEFQGAKLKNRVLRGERAGIAIFRKGMRGAGKLGWSKRPASFNRTRTRSHNNAFSVSLSPKSPLSTIFEHGAKAHEIPIGGRRFIGPLFGGQSRTSHSGAVRHHPGVAARPFVGPIFAADEAAALAAVDAKLLEGI